LLVMTVGQLDQVLLVGAAVLLLAVVAARVAARTGLPSLLLFLGLGVLLGEDAIGIQFDDFELSRALGYAALVVILAEGGLTTHWATIRPVVRVSAVLATAGVGISVAVTAVAARYLLDLGWQSALLVGSVVATTDAAAVFSVLRRLGLPRRIPGVLEAESGMNDAPAILLVVALSTSHAWGPGEISELVGMMAYELGAGAVIGLVLGRLGAEALRRVALPASGLYPLAVLAFAVLAYAAAAVAHASGFIAVYLAGLVLGNSRLPHGPATRGFAEGLAWLAQIGLFTMLGLLVTPSRLGSAILPGLGIGLVLLLVARPVSVLLSTWWFRLPAREQVFLSWAGLRGAVPIVLAILPIVAGTQDAQRLFNLVFVLVVAFTLLQGPTLPAVARRLKVVARSPSREIDVESAPLEHLDAHLLQVRIGADSRIHGVEVRELRLPAGAAVTLVVRDGTSFVPSPATTLHHGDELLLVTTTPAQRETERRLRAVSRRGKLAGWFGERGT
jgi:cell volume regulation protein A